MARAAPLAHLIDGPVYVFRAYYALPPMAAPDGTPTNAAYGYASSLLKYLADFEPSHAAVAFDHAMTSFRNEIFPAYKAQRDEPPADLEPQFELCRQVTEALGLASFERPAYEADDLIATLVAGLVRRRARAVIVSTDKDLAQLVREDGRVSLYDPAKRQKVDADGVRARFGVDPSQIPDYLGLMGDAVDNLPGVPGVGTKSAAAALRRPSFTSSFGISTVVGTETSASQAAPPCQTLLSCDGVRGRPDRHGVRSPCADRPCRGADHSKQ